MSQPSEWQEITDILTPEGVSKLKKGQVLSFDYEGSRSDYKITKIKAGRVWVKPILTFSPNEADAKLKEDGFEPHNTKAVLKENLQED